MTKRGQNLIIVSTIFVLLLCLLFFLISMPAPESDTQTKESELTFENIIDTSDKKIVNVAVKNSEESYEIKAETKDGKQVYILSDFDEAKTAQSYAEAMYDSVINLKPEQILENVEDLSTYGLEQPSAELTITFEDGRKTALYLGNDAPLSKGAYMKVDNDAKVYLISQTDKEIFLNEKSFYQEKSKD